jgi:hypothetical protein
MLEVLVLAPAALLRAWQVGSLRCYLRSMLLLLLLLLLFMLHHFHHWFC